MNWYKGNIAEAVQRSKTINAIFVVFVEGKDESSQKLTQFINEERICAKLQSDDFVAIKIESDSQAYMQFASIYQMVPVPSIFFIGKSGTPLEIGTGVIASSAELEQKIDKVLAASGKSTPSVSSNSSFITAEQEAAAAPAAAATPVAAPAAATPVATTSMTLPVASKTATQNVVDTTTSANVDDNDEEVICKGGVCFKKQKTLKTAESKELEKEENKPVVVTEVNPPTATAAVVEDSIAVDAANTRLEETRKLLEKKRRERVELEKKEEKERELQRRRDGKEVQHLHQWQKEQELKELKDNIRRERLEEQAARERIRAQIAGDRAERAQIMATDAEKASNSTSSSPQQAKPQQPSSSVDKSRLQFRFSSGDNRTQTFNCQDTLGTVRNYVVTELLPGTGIRDFILATTYPKREFSTEQDEQTLVELGLFPSAVILVIGKERSSSNPAAIIARSGGIVNMLSTIFWAMLSPVVAIFGFIKNIGSRRGAAGNDGAQKRANEEQGAQHEAAKRRNLDRFTTGPSTSKEASAADTPSAGDTEPKPYRRYGSSNIHRLTDTRKDSDDENATWNGNSTQQQ